MSNKKIAVLLFGAAFALTLAGCADDNQHDSVKVTYPVQVLGDDTIADHVSDVLEADPQLQNFDIEVSAEDGVVRLHGTVDTDAQYAQVGQDAVGVEGVKAIANTVKIRHPVTLTK